ncbi:MAG: hypothetical protein PHV23_01430 [Candidatus Gracilibacteria bacterium]|nr:hypothetical protein [Candidatus Gracilibacteria bacterium]
MTKTQNDKSSFENMVYFQNFINFFHNKGSLFQQRREIKDYKFEVDEIELIGENNKKDEKYYYPNINYKSIQKSVSKKEKTNLFFSINGFYRNRKSKNLKSLNCFYFDLDYKDNPNIKDNMESIIEKIRDSFDIIIKSRNGYHFYNLLSEGQYKVDEKDKYIKDRKEKGKHLENIFGVNFDPKVYDVSRISRIGYSYHQKNDKDLFMIEIIKGKELISPLFERQKLINLTPIKEVVKFAIQDELITDVQIINEDYYRNGKLSDGLKIDDITNTIKDFSTQKKNEKITKKINEKIENEYDEGLNKTEDEEEKINEEITEYILEYTGIPYTFIKKIFFYKLIEDGKGFKTAEADSRTLTYSFFAKHFGILSENGIKKNIIIPKGIENILYKSNLSSLELKYFLGLMNFSQGTRNSINYLGINKKVSLYNFADFNGFDKNVSKIKKNLETLLENQKINESYQLLKGEIIKENKEYFISYTITPNYLKLDKTIKNTYYYNHYINKKILDIPTNGNYLNLIYRIYFNLINLNCVKSYTISKDEVIKDIGDSNIQRIKKKLIDLSESLDNVFSVEIKGDELVFEKN